MVTTKNGRRSEPSGALRIVRVAALACLVGWACAGGATAGAQAPSRAADELDPAPLGRLFERHVKDGAVDYRGLRRDATARAGLTRFLDAAAAMPENAPLASWLNVYNALVIEGVLRHYPIESVKAVPDFFTEARRKVAGKKRSLDDIENGVVRPRFQDARVHMALNCAAVSCPPLADHAFRQAGLDRELDRLTRHALEDPRVARLEGDVLHHSKLFEWFRADFVRDAGSVKAWIVRHAGEGPLRTLPEGTKLRAMAYDWSLAEAK